MKTISTLNLPPNATMAHVMVELGVFPSLSQARKNGWDRPIVLGQQLLTKNKIAVNIVDVPVEKTEKFIEKADKQPGFWVDFVDEMNNPAHRSNVDAAIQFPLDHNWSGRIINAHLKDLGILK